VKIGRRRVERFREQGFDIHYIHRMDRTGFKAGALENGMKTAKGELIAVFDADFTPHPDCLRRWSTTSPMSGSGWSRLRWSHINAATRC
jgi:hypothetical protein